jgi:aspartyl-tRNA(Asn)/glutamyl-tRNA(Gln) amidotransferase subunit C
MESIYPMSLQRSDIEKIAHLARLAVTEEDIPRYVRELSNILQMVEQMNGVDTRTVVPMAHPMEASQRLRPDEINEADQREQFQSIAPQVEAGLYLVPKVIE